MSAVSAVTRSFAFVVVASTLQAGAATARASGAEALGPIAAAAPEPTGTLTLSEVLSIALVSSPELAPFAWQVRTEEARTLQAALLPNPTAELLVEDVLGTGSFEGGREAQLTLQLGQLIELGGKRRARVETASRSTDFARGEYEVKRVEVLADVTGKFIDVLERQHGLDLADNATRLGEATLQTTRLRVQAGAASPAEEKRAAIALARSRLAEEDLRHELAVSRTVLAATW
ncbi:MAG: TolC family protein, partial [Candidatus Binatia bacterium]